MLAHQCFCKMLDSLHWSKAVKFLINGKYFFCTHKHAFVYCWIHSKSHNLQRKWVTHRKKHLGLLSKAHGTQVWDGSLSFIVKTAMGYQASHNTTAKEMCCLSSLCTSNHTENLCDSPCMLFPDESWPKIKIHQNLLQVAMQRHLLA